MEDVMINPISNNSDSKKEEFLNYIQIETDKILYLINNIKTSKELYDLTVSEYQDKVMGDYKGQSVLYSRYGLIWKDMLTPMVYGPFATIFDSPSGSFILIHEDVSNWENDEKIMSKHQAYEFFMDHERKHALDYKNIFYRRQMKKAYMFGKENFDLIHKFELRADKTGIKELKRLYPNKVVVRALMFVYKFLSINTNHMNENIRAHREFALKFLNKGILSENLMKNLIKEQTEVSFRQVNERLDYLEKRLKIFENEIKILNQSGTILVDF